MSSRAPSVDGVGSFQCLRQDFSGCPGLRFVSFFDSTQSMSVAAFHRTSASGLTGRRPLLRRALASHFP